MEVSNVARFDVIRIDLAGPVSEEGCKESLEKKTSVKLTQKRSGDSCGELIAAHRDVATGKVLTGTTAPRP